jgi:hypothetical protein
MFRQPKSVVTPILDVLGEITRVAERVGCGVAFADWGEIEDRKPGHK